MQFLSKVLQQKACTVRSIRHIKSKFLGCENFYWELIVGKGKKPNTVQDHVRNYAEYVKEITLMCAGFFFLTLEKGQFSYGTYYIGQYLKSIIQFRCRKVNTKDAENVVRWIIYPVIPFIIMTLFIEQAWSVYSIESVIII